MGGGASGRPTCRETCMRETSTISRTSPEYRSPSTKTDSSPVNPATFSADRGLPQTSKSWPNVYSPTAGGSMWTSPVPSWVCIQ